ncbi:MAG: methyltransferase domain-containing protein [Anaerohalosphaeraceae bacterium]
MKTLNNMGLQQVQTVYSGAEGRLWELLMGQQIHIGGLTSSMDLAQKAGIKPGSSGVDFCSCTGAGMRFLVRFCGVGAMTGVDATETMVKLGKQRCIDEGLDDKIRFVLADVCNSGLPAAAVDFVWGEDAWCYVEDKPKMIAEATRLVKPGGIVAFTDWVEGPTPMSEDDARRFQSFMKFPNLADIDDYRKMLTDNNCKVVIAENTGRYAPCINLYIQMVSQQLTYDALKILNFDQAVFEKLAEEMMFVGDLAGHNKIIQGLFVAKKG